MMKTNKSEALKLAVIGGGASGLVAAISAVRQAEKQGRSVKVTIYESNSRVGKKLLATGNGRCNFTNDSVEKHNFHGDADFAEKVYTRFNNADIKAFFYSVGVFPKSDAAGRVYPMSLQASSVLDALRCETARLGIEEITDTMITEFRRKDSGFLLNSVYYADKVIIAAGGKAAPVHGSDGNMLSLLKKYGIEITPLLPALTPMQCDSFPKILKGIRAQGRITLRCLGRILAEDTGEIQYTDYGLSGIPSMQVSGFAARALYEKRGEVTATVDSCPSMEKAELKRELLRLIRSNPDMPGELLLAGLMPKRLGMTILSDCSVNPSKSIGMLREGVVDKIVSQIKGKKYKINSVKGFNDAQVTSGGISTEGIDENTLELKMLRGAYACGEIINVDGDCGGYNLQWAWSSGMLAGISAVREK